MFRFASLGSGSRGNAGVVQSCQTTVLVDCGFSAAEAERRLARLALSAEDVDAVFVTHEHTDHVGGVARFARKHRIDVFMTTGTRRAIHDLERVQITEISPHQPLTIGDLQVQPYPVPHDAREPCQYVFGDGARRLGVLSDAGHVTPHMTMHLSDCDALFIETNHDIDMLADSPYPPALRERVGGRLGHLSNKQSAELLDQIRHERLQHVVCGHLSEKNNRPDLARTALAGVLNCAPDWIGLADQEQGIAWRQIA